MDDAVAFQYPSGSALVTPCLWARACDVGCSVACVEAGHLDRGCPTNKCAGGSVAQHFVARGGPAPLLQTRCLGNPFQGPHSRPISLGSKRVSGELRVWISIKLGFRMTCLVLPDCLYMDYTFFSSHTFSLAGHFPFNPPETSVLAMRVSSYLSA